MKSTDDESKTKKMQLKGGNGISGAMNREIWFYLEL
jgi:hypothetical protein